MVDLHQLFQGLQTIQVWHQHVQNDEIRAVASLNLLDRSRPDTTVSTWYPSTSSRVPKYFRMLGSSSTTRILSCSAICAPTFVLRNTYRLSIGSRNVKVHPRRGSLSTQILPQCACTSRLAIAKPRPIPEDVRSTRTKSSKIS